MADASTISFNLDPAYPWSIPGAGPVAFLVVGSLLVAITV